MIAYVLDKTNLKVKDYFPFEKYSFATDIEYSDKSKITAPKQVNIRDDDLIFCMDGTKTAYRGICSNGDTTDKSTNHEIVLKQMECLFDRQIFVGDDTLIPTGIEQFIASEITANWVNSGDTLMDRPYIEPVAASTTPVAASLSGIVNIENGVYNLKTLLGNIKERYGIFLDFILTDTNPRIQTGPRLIVRIYRDTAAAVPIDTDVSDISNCEETYSVDLLAKLKVRWKIPDETDTNGNVVTVGAVTDRAYYLTISRSITDDPDDPDRVDGTTKSVYVESETEDGMLEEVQHQFQENTYSHKVTFSLRKESELYRPESYYVGRKCTLETKTGIKTSVITAIEDDSRSATRLVTMGKLKVTLTERLRDLYG